jgi:hypothetical protein
MTEQQIIAVIESMTFLRANLKTTRAAYASGRGSTRREYSMDSRGNTDHLAGAHRGHRGHRVVSDRRQRRSTAPNWESPVLCSHATSSTGVARHLHGQSLDAR